MKAKTTVRTLKHWGWTTCFITNHNVSGKEATQEFRQLIKTQFPGYVLLPAHRNSFREHQPSHGCNKLIIKAWAWRGNWSNPIKQVYARLYKPAAQKGETK